VRQQIPAPLKIGERRFHGSPFRLDVKCLQQLCAFAAKLFDRRIKIGTIVCRARRSHEQRLHVNWPVARGVL
jgi:hypothetical protein